MCGIAGIYPLKQSVFSRADELNKLHRMTATLAHRGPEGTGYFLNEEVGLGHTRLSIIDPEGGEQPIHNEDRTIWISFNGEIFNYIELRNDLIARGHQFYTSTDTEVIVHAYESFGDDFVQRLNGQFAFALWDGRQHRLLLGRDRVGIAPLFYTQVSDKLHFSSEMKALHAISPHRPEADIRGLNHVSTLWAGLAPKTVFKDIFELEPGHLLVAEAGKWRTKEYWNWAFPRADDLHHGDQKRLTEEFHEILFDATRIRLRADVEVGGYLSGGIDSSSLMKLMSDLQPDVAAYSLQFERSDLDESYFQRLVASELNVHRHHVEVAEVDIAKNLESAVCAAETPLVRTGPVPLGRLSALVKSRGKKVVLTGEGADEVLGGYDLFKEQKVREYIARDPSSKIRPQLLKNLYPYLDFTAGQSTNLLRKVFGEFGHNDLKYNAYSSHIMRWRNASQIHRFWQPERNAEAQGNIEDLLIADISACTPSDFNAWHPFNRAQWLEARILMNGYILSSQGDRMLMSNSVEGRFPFLDHRLIEFANQLHPLYKMPGLSEKNLLKRAFRNQIPQEIVRRPKQPYRASGTNLIRNPAMENLVENYLEGDQIDKTGFFQAKMMTKFLHKLRTQDTLSFRDETLLITMLTTQIWHHKLIERWSQSAIDSKLT